MRPCLHCSKPLARGQRCKCRGTNQASRGYGPSYQADRATTLADNPLCHWCQQRPGTTADHLPALATATTPADWQGVLVPACTTCQATPIPERDTPANR